MFSVKRSHSDVSGSEERLRDNSAIYGQPTAIKRGKLLMVTIFIEKAVYYVHLMVYTPTWNLILQIISINEWPHKSVT